MLIGLLIAVIVLALVIVALGLRLTVTRERDFVRAVMTPEEARNVITAAELDAVAGNRKARKALPQGPAATAANADAPATSSTPRTTSP